MARHLQRHFTLPVIQPKAKEQILMNVLHALARELTKHRSFQHTPLIVLAVRNYVWHYMACYYGYKNGSKYKIDIYNNGLHILQNI